MTPRRAPQRSSWIWLAFLAIPLLAVACLSAPPPLLPTPDPDPDPDPDPNPDTVVEYVVTLTASETVVLAGHEVAIAATVVPAFDGELTWSHDGGQLAVTGASATFTAPGAAGTYRISAAVGDDPASATSVDVTVSGGLSEPFSIVVIPDTQNMVTTTARSRLLVVIGEWIVAQLEPRGIEFVTHVGDIVYDPTLDYQWTRALAGLDLFDGFVPYSVALGDHEYYPEEDKGGSTEAYRSRFGPERYEGYDWYGGAHDDGLSHFQYFTGGGREFLHLAVEWEPTGTADDPATPLGWARSIIEAHPTTPTIITTHAYVWDMPGEEGRFTDADREGTDWVNGVRAPVGASGETLFRELVEPFPQVFMVLNGHYHKALIPDKGKFHQVSVNGAGSNVYEMLSNFQGWNYGGDGYLRLIDFVPGGGADGLDRIDVSTYSPWLDQFQEDDRARFSFDLDFGRRFVGD